MIVDDSAIAAHQVTIALEYRESEVIRSRLFVCLFGKRLSRLTNLVGCL
jgi:hypothetical protein